MSALSADHRRIFAGFEAWIAVRSSGDGFFSTGTAALRKKNSNLTRFSESNSIFSVMSDTPNAY